MMLVSVQVQGEVSPLQHARDIEEAIFEALKAKGVADKFTVMKVELVTIDTSDPEDNTE